MSTSQEDEILQQKAHALLFDPGQRVCFQYVVASNEPHFLSYPWNSDPRRFMPFCCLNTFREESVVEGSPRRQQNIASILGLTIEQDVMGKELQQEWFRTIFPNGPTVAVDSAGKSVHHHLRLTEAIDEETHEKIAALLKKVFPFSDHKVFNNTATLCRNPGGHRDGDPGKLQRVLFLGQRFSSQDILVTLRDAAEGIGSGTLKEARWTMEYLFSGEIPKPALKKWDKKIPDLLIAGISQLLGNGYRDREKLWSLIHKTFVENFIRRGRTEQHLLEYLEKAKAHLEATPKTTSAKPNRTRKTTTGQQRQRIPWIQEVLEKAKKSNRWLDFWTQEEGITFPSGTPDHDGFVRGFPPGKHSHSTPGWKCSLETGYYYSHYDEEGKMPQDYLAEKHGVSVIEAWRKLAEFFGVRVPTTIVVEGGQIHNLVEAGETSLIDFLSTIPAHERIYQRSGLLIRVVSDAKPPQGISHTENVFSLCTMEVAYLVESMTKAASWVKWDGRAENYRNIDCPKYVAETLLSHRGYWRFPYLEGVITAPTLRHDGSILQTPGYDTATGLLFNPSETKYPLIPERPSIDDAGQALSTFKSVLQEFPFVAEVDMSVILSAILTSLVRRSLRTAPGHAVTAPQPATGKSLLCDVVALIATGRRVVCCSQAESAEEEKKRLLALLMAGYAVVCLDNIEKPLRSDALCTILTAEEWSERILGSNTLLTVPTGTCFLANGNNLSLQGDLTSRFVLCRLDAKIERPEERKCGLNLYEYIPQHRGELVCAALTILRAYHYAGKPDVGLKPFGRFEDWSNLVRCALVWVGMTDPCRSREFIEEADPEKEILTALLMAWYEVERQPVTVQQLIAKSISQEALRKVLLEIAEDGGSISSRKLGNYLRRIEGRIITGVRLERKGIQHSAIKWMVRKME